MRTSALATLVAAVLAVVGLGAIGAPAQAARSAQTAAAPTRSLEVLQFNAADGADCRPHGNRCLAALQRTIDGDATAPDLVTIEEVCERDLAGLEKHLETHGLKKTWTIRFVPLTTNYPYCPGGRKGQALATPHTMDTPVDRISLGGDFTGHITFHGEKRKLPKKFYMLCAKLQVTSRSTARACVVHLRTSGRAAKKGQLRKILSATARWRSAGSPVIVGGDFNINDRDPKARAQLAPMRAAFGEADDARHGATHGAAKLDYVWFSRKKLAATSGQVGSSGRSDHRMLRGTATYRT